MSVRSTIRLPAGAFSYLEDGSGPPLVFLHALGHSFEDMETDVRVFVDRLELDQLSIVAHSMGQTLRGSSLPAPPIESRALSSRTRHHRRQRGNPGASGATARAGRLTRTAVSPSWNGMFDRPDRGCDQYAVVRSIGWNNSVRCWHAGSAGHAAQCGGDASGQR